MSYEEKMLYVKQELLQFVTDRIVHNYPKEDFPNWLLCKADYVFGYGYELIFKEQFGIYINSDTVDILWFAGKNIIFAIQAFLSTKENVTLEEILSFTERFLIHQFITIDTWCKPILQQMYLDTQTHTSSS